MHRGLIFGALFVVTTALVGCSPEGSPNTTAPSPEAAKEAAAKMPPPPGTKPAAPAK
jgi:hypothetical protein